MSNTEEFNTEYSVMKENAGTLTDVPQNADAAGVDLPDDRRNALRQRSIVDTLIVESAELGTLICPVNDLSRRGMRLRMPVCIPCGSEILIHPPKGTDLRISRAQIVRQYLVYRDGETWYECGVQFTEAAELRRHTWFLSLRLAEKADAA